MNHIEEETKMQTEEWEMELVEDLKREVFDKYFVVKYSASDWKKILQNGKRHRGIQTNRCMTTQYGKPLLNKSELGRLCYILKLTPNAFNNIFGTKITASSAPSSQKAFCKQSENDERTNIYSLCKEIFDRYGKPLLVPGMSEEDLEKELKHRNNESLSRIAELKALIETETELMTKMELNYKQAIDTLQKNKKKKQENKSPKQ